MNKVVTVQRDTHICHKDCINPQRMCVSMYGMIYIFCTQIKDPNYMFIPFLLTGGDNLDYPVMVSDGVDQPVSDNE